MTQTNSSTEQKQTHRHRDRPVVAKGARVGGGMCWEFGISRCKLLKRGWINNIFLLNSTGNYIQYPVINHNGKEYEKECICITESLSCIAEMNITLSIIYMLIKYIFLKREFPFFIVLIFLLRFPMCSLTRMIFFSNSLIRSLTAILKSFFC